MIVFLEPAHHSVGRGKSVGTTAGQQHGIDLLDRMARVEQIGLAGTRTAAPDVDSGDHTGRREHDRAAGGCAASESGSLVELVVMTDGEAGDICQ